MSKFTHAVTQALLVVVAVGTHYSTLVAPKYQPIVLATVALAQAILGVVNHGSH